MRNSLNFGGINSADYGIYISGTGVYDAPKRVVEKVTIPGRNGALMMDQDRYENITVEYPAFAYGKNRREFSEKIAAFRNALMSQTGYQRLEDSYHPDEYRMALYAEGLDVSVGAYGGAGKFTLKFDCKPQRFLKDGERIIQRNSGEAIVNPTKHAAEPLLIVNGYGDIQIGEHKVSVSDGTIGTIHVSDRLVVQNHELLRSWNINESQYNPGDHVVINGLSVKSAFTITNDLNFLDQSTVYPDRVMGIEYYNSQDTDAQLSYSKSGKTANFGITIPALELTIGQNLTKKYSTRETVHFQRNGADQGGNRVYSSFWVIYENGRLEIKASPMLLNTGGGAAQANPVESSTANLGEIIGESTLSILEDAVYIDCETGEAYAIKGDGYTSLNSIVDLGADMLKLEPGRSDITFDSTVESLSMIPRWWQI